MLLNPQVMILCKFVCVCHIEYEKLNTLVQDNNDQIRLG